MTQVQEDPASAALTIPIDRLRDFVHAAAASAGVGAADLPLFVTAVIEADLRGIDSHGVFRLPFYLRAVRTGAIKGMPEVAVVRARGATAVLDADNGLGIVVGQRAMDHAVELARTHGIGVVAVRHSNHSGMLAVHVLRAAAAGLVGFFVSNAPALMAPWGGREAMLSNGPFAWSIPTRDEPIVLDMACSAVARGRIRLAAHRNEAIPVGWAIDADGAPALDGRSAMEGLVLPMAGHKGSGIAVVNEILSAALPGALLSVDVSRAFLADGARALDAWQVGHLAMAIDPAAFVDIDDFLDQVQDLVDRLHASDPASGHDRVLVPGEPEAMIRAGRLRDGVPISAAVLRHLDEFADEIGLAPLGERVR